MISKIVDTLFCQLTASQYDISMAAFLKFAKNFPPSCKSTFSCFHVTTTNCLLQQIHGEWPNKIDQLGHTTLHLEHFLVSRVPFMLCQKFWYSGEWWTASEGTQKNFSNEPFDILWEKFAEKKRLYIYMKKLWAAFQLIVVFYCLIFLSRYTFIFYFNLFHCEHLWSQR